MAREIIILLTNFDWGIAIPFLIFICVCAAVAVDVHKDYKKQNIKKKGKSRYEYH